MDHHARRGKGAAQRENATSHHYELRVRPPAAAAASARDVNRDRAVAMRASTEKSSRRNQSHGSRSSEERIDRGRSKRRHRSLSRDGSRKRQRREQPRRARRHSGERRNRHRERRRRQHSSSKSSVDNSETRKNDEPRAGVVSIEEETGRESRRTTVDNSRHKAQQQSPPRSPSAHDDTIGHFNGLAGTVIGDRYKILREVGLGTFGRVVECLNTGNKSEHGHHTSRERSSYVAIKIVRNVRRYYESALIEARIVEAVNRRGGRGRTHCVLLHDTFTFNGHFCMVFESLGPSLYDFLKRHKYQPFPMVCVQDFAIQLLETVEFLHGFRLIHTDLKIENILLTNDREITYRNQQVPESTRIKVIDFGGACYDSDKKSSVINTRQYRAPEVILGTGWSMPSDMWSVGCILAELYRGELLFATHDNAEHLALIERMIGFFPRRMVKAAQNNQDMDLARDAFDSSGRHRLGRVLAKENVSFVRRAAPLESLIGSEDAWFLNLLRMILVIDPHERATAHECLQYLKRVRRNVLRCS